MVAAQKVKEAEITEQDSLLLTRNLLRIAIFNISYIRGLFPEKYFNDKSVPALEMKIKKLMPLDAESRRLIDWMEKGVYDALQKKYLKTLFFCVCETVDGPMIEEYAFSFSYSGSDKQEVSMNINRTGNKKQGGTFKSNSTTEITPQQMRSSACKMIRTLVQLMRTLDKMPEERTILMKLIYYDDVTPADYEPPFFRCCTEEEARCPWTKSPLKMEVGSVNSKHFVLALKVKSVLDPCEDQNEQMQDDDMSSGADSTQRDEYLDSDSEVDHTQGQGDRYIVAPIEKQPQANDGMDDQDNTQDSMEDDRQLDRVKDWIHYCHLDTVELTDVLANFPDISVVLIEEIMEKLVKEDVLSETGKDTYTINKQKRSDEYEFSTVKEEADDQTIQVIDGVPQVEDSLYMKALYHALPMTYVTVAKLHNKLEGEVSQTAVRKIIHRMIQDGFIEPKGSRRLGKRVIHSELTQRKLMEVQKALMSTSVEAMEIDHSEPNSKCKLICFHANGSNNREGSTCGVLHSIGSDLTRMRVRSDTNQTDSTRSGLKVRELGNTPTSRVEPVTSRESFAPGKENSIANERSTINQGNEVETLLCTNNSQDKRSRKTSTVIYGFVFPV
ncbi:meiosis-specific protein ASY1 isoform X2 [Neltuma alba]|uniref:meiosis-specific protein ASY1 isoform X2 n=1 Tax=Neltuma alba TaxID=207710 RepID=UPI0010A49885|nr:meiosis-specific protein ASY1 isoform X2 [Prosopis alba]